MKKIMVTVALTAIVTLTACSGANNEVSVTNTPISTLENVTTEAAANSETPKPNNIISSTEEIIMTKEPSTIETFAPTESANYDVFDIFEVKLSELGYDYEKKDVLATMIGAYRGNKYLIGDGRIELYEFEKDSEALKVATEKNAFTLEGFGDFPCFINGNFALYIDGIEDDSRILDAFNSLTR